MKVAESIKLSEVLKLIAKPRYILGTTYTLSLAFFESVVFPFIDRSHLKSCLILCDMIGYQRALAESSALLGAAQDYMVVPAPIEGAFHPKVWLIIGESEALLLTGSGNLTQAGFMTNAEYFDALHFSAENPASPEIMGSMREFLKGLAGMWPSEDSAHLLCIETLNRMEQTLNTLPTPAGRDSSPQFLHSFRGQLIDQMPAMSPAVELYVAAPFFGNSLEGLNLLVARHRPTRLHIFPGVHGGDATDIPLKEVAKAYRGAKIARIVVPGKADAHAHLKLYGITGKDSMGWLCCTSANCTIAAWKGPNVEAGLLRPVQRSTLADYFVPDRTEIPGGSLRYTPNASTGDTLYCWGTDSGGGLDLAVAAASRTHLPLKDVTLTVSAGSYLATCRKAILFQEGSFMHLPWAAFEGWHRPRKMAVCLHVTAQNAAGKAVRGGCLVENRLLLTADPIHRSAWRGALALLDAEGAPELADVAAIFTLARDLFDGTFLRPRAVADDSQPVKTVDEQEPPAIAVWPPQPDLSDLQKHIGRTAVGHVQWFQRIMQTFLRAEASDNATPRQADVTDTSDGNGEDNGQFTPRQREQEEQRTRNVTQRLWDHAWRDYEGLRNRLHALCPTEGQAPNIWLAAIFTFLPTLAVLRAAKRIAPDLDCGTSIQYLCETFLCAMLDIRKQNADFCCPKGFRYRSETFPALADDLRATFKIHIHPDLTNVMLALIVDWRLRIREGLYSLMWPRYVKQVCEGEYVADGENRESCRRVWRRYIADTADARTDEDFCRTYDELCGLR